MFKRWDKKTYGSVGHWAAELTVVAFGVLIALAAQGWANDRQKGRDGAEAEARTKEEILTNIWQLTERRALRNCLKDRLNNLEHALSNGSSAWQAFVYPSPFDERGAFARLYRVPSRIWVQDAYLSAVENGNLDTLDLERQGRYAALYRQLSGLETMNEQENALASRLSPIRLKSGNSQAVRDDMLVALAELDRLNALTVLVAEQIMENSSDMKIAFDPEDIKLAKKNNEFNQALDRWHSTYGACVDDQAFLLIDPLLTP